MQRFLPRTEHRPTRSLPIVLEKQVLRGGAPTSEVVDFFLHVLVDPLHILYITARRGRRGTREDVDALHMAVVHQREMIFFPLSIPIQ